MQAEKITNLKRPKVDILPIKPEEISKYWPLADFMIREALRFSGQFAEAEDIKDALINAEMQLFLVLDTRGMVSIKYLRLPLHGSRILRD